MGFWEGSEMWVGRVDGSLRELGWVGFVGSVMLVLRENGDGCSEVVGGVLFC